MNAPSRPPAAARPRCPRCGRTVDFPGQRHTRSDALTVECREAR